MIFPFYIARRYLFSKKSRNVINIISGISVCVIAAVSFALLVVLSAFNGLENLVEDLYSSFDPDISITAKKGKLFALDTFNLDGVVKTEGVNAVWRSLEETVYIEYNDQSSLATLKGVDDAFISASGLDSMMFEGDLVLHDGNRPLAVTGYGIAGNLKLMVTDNPNPLKIYAAKRDAPLGAAAENAFRQSAIQAAGIFTINPDFDDKYILVPYSFAEDVLDAKEKVTGIELSLQPGFKAEQVKQGLQSLVGSDYSVVTRYELNELIFKTNKTEKLVTYLILTFILIIAIFNVIGSLTMLILEKKKDIFILRSLGADRKKVLRIFQIEGLLINLCGVTTGLILGVVLCLLQQYIGLVRLHNIVVEYYPVQLSLPDVLLILCTVMAIGWVASWLPVRMVAAAKYRASQ